MKDVILNQREQARLRVLNSVLVYQLDRAQAAEIMGISERQLRRILAAYRREGAAALSLATGVASPATRFPRMWPPRWSPWPAGNTPASTTAT